ncbi:MAG: hypothetical protein HYU53_00875 [Acidobacteria bacterium]|nr:hypothetical protein [Acidobacteriota bacterium]
MSGPPVAAQERPLTTFPSAMIGPAMCPIPTPASATDHASVPVRASTAIRCPSLVKWNSRSPNIAMFRTLRPRGLSADLEAPPALALAGGSHRNSQIRSPFAASSAWMTSPAWAMYIVPFRTSGVAYCPPGSMARDHASCSRSTLSRVISASGL